MSRPVRMTVDLSACPDLVVIYLGMRVDEPRGYATLERLGPQIQASVEEQPDGLLLHENITFSQEPLHVGMRQYWRDPGALEAWSLTLPHKAWWSEYLRDRGGTSFWHEAYYRRGGIEAMFVDTGTSIGLSSVGPAVPAEGPLFAARGRAEADRATARASA
jgi:hypothetical protein